MKGLFNASSPSSGKMNDPAELAAFVNAVLVEGHAYGADQRRQGTRRLMAVMEEYTLGTTSIDTELATTAVSALKTLGRSSEGTEDLASEEGIHLLLEIAQFSSTGTTDTFLRDPLPTASSEAVRCLANVCLLHESARVRLAGIYGLPAALLKGEEQATDTTTRFLASRLLFLITVSGGNAVSTLVEDLNIAGSLSRRLLDMLEGFTSSASKPAPILVEVLTEHLKVAFNVTLFYPRAVAERKNIGNDKLSPARENSRENGKGKGKVTSSKMSKSISSFSSSSSRSGSRSSSPGEYTTGRTSPRGNASTTSTVPGTSTKARLTSPSNVQKTASEKIKGYFSRKGKEPEKVANMYHDDADVLRPWGFDSVVNVLTQLALCLPFGTGADYGPFGLYKHTINALINYDFTAYSDTIFAPLVPASAPVIPNLPFTSPSKATPSLPPLVATLLTLLDGCAAFYIPGASGPDDNDAREAALSAPSNLDESLQVLIMLMTKCAVEDVTGDARRGFKQCLLADDIDRSIGLEKRKDLTGRLIRLMNSTYLSGSNDAASKFLFAICEQDPSVLVAAIGYGNASGFLQSMNMLIPPGATAAPEGSPDEQDSENPEQSPSSSSSRAINPITGAYEQQSSSNEPPMTDEEKEREAEKLFVLFDRMNRNGAMSVVNPVKEAQNSGKLITTAEEEELERKRLKEEEDEDERQALAEMQRYKERKLRGGQL